jgi:hypothetical protein
MLHVLWYIGAWLADTDLCLDRITCNSYFAKSNPHLDTLSYFRFRDEHNDLMLQIYSCNR